MVSTGLSYSSVISITRKTELKADVIKRPKIDHINISDFPMEGRVNHGKASGSVIPAMGNMQKSNMLL